MANQQGVPEDNSEKLHGDKLENVQAASKEVPKQGSARSHAVTANDTDGGGVGGSQDGMLMP